MTISGSAQTLPGFARREKLGLQLLIGLLYGLFLICYFNRGTDILIPFTDNYVDLGAAYVLFLIVVLVGSSNAVNSLTAWMAWQPG